MRILHLVGKVRIPQSPDHEAVSGLGRTVLEIARAQVCLGHDVTVVAPGKIAGMSKWEGVNLSWQKPYPWARVPTRSGMLDLSWQVPNIVQTTLNKFDVIHSHLHYLRGLRAPCRVVHFHSDPFYSGSENQAWDLTQADFARILKDSNAQIAVSKFVANQLNKGFLGRGNIHTVYNGVRYELFDNQQNARQGAEFRKKLGIPTGHVVILYVGAITTEKGVIYLAKAFKKLVEETTSIHLVLAGSGSLWGLNKLKISRGEYEKHVIEVLEPLIKNGAVISLGNVSSLDMPGVLAASDLVVVPSIWQEGFGLVAVEALASGRPVVASNTGGLPEIVNESNGILVEPGNAELLSKEIKRLITDSELRAQLSKNAKKTVEHLNWMTTAEQILRIYTEIL